MTGQGQRKQETPRVWLPGPDVLLPGAVLILALGVRLVWALYSQADPTDGRFDDSLLYHRLAIGLRDGDGYTFPFTGLPTASWPPGYPVLLAGVYSVFGVSVVAAKVANALLGVLSTAALYVLGRQLFDRPSAAIGALLMAFMPGQIFFTGILWSEVVFTFLYLLILIGIAILPRRPTRERLAWAAAVGLLIAASAYVRETALSLIPVAVLYWAWSTHGWRRALSWGGVTFIVAALLITPWTVRNFVKLDGFVLLSSSTGGNFWIGHNEEATGGLVFIDPSRMGEPPTGAGAEAYRSRQGIREGLGFLIRHPLKELDLSKEKVRLLYQGDSVGLALTEGGTQPFENRRLREALEHLADGMYYAILVLAGLAMVRWVRERDAQPLLPVLAIGFLTLGYVVFWGDQRFHFPVVPLFCLLAGWALVGIGRSATQSSLR